MRLGARTKWALIVPIMKCIRLRRAFFLRWLIDSFTPNLTTLGSSACLTSSLGNKMVSNEKICFLQDVDPAETLPNKSYSSNHKKMKTIPYLTAHNNIACHYMKECPPQFLSRDITVIAALSVSKTLQVLIPMTWKLTSFGDAYCSTSK